MAHPGFRPSVARTSFGAEREVELAALTGRAAKAALAAAGIERCTFAALVAGRPVGEAGSPAKEAPSGR
jgi:predicted glycoside hydrolase/deacetylase ChbG (UPF0249 family)